jgi:hypothetical protein
MLKARMLVQRHAHVRAKREEAGVPLAYQLTYMVADSPVPGQKIRLPRCGSLHPQHLQFDAAFSFVHERLLLTV